MINTLISPLHIVSLVSDITLDFPEWLKWAEPAINFLINEQQFWIYLIAGAIMMLLLQLIIKKTINKFKGFIITVLIIAVVILIIVGIILLTTTKV